MSDKYEVNIISTLIACLIIFVCFIWIYIMSHTLFYFLLFSCISFVVGYCCGCVRDRDYEKEKQQ